MFWGITGKDVLAAVGVVLLIATLMKDVFGVNMIGKKIYKGAPLWWKAFMKWITASQDTSDKMDKMMQDIAEIKVQVEYNGGSSMKDAVRRVEEKCSTVIVMVDKNNKRMNIADLANDRMTFTISPNGACTEINEVFLKKFGYSEEDVLGFAFEQIVFEDDVIEMRTKWQRAIDQKGRFYDEQRIIDSRGKQHLCCVRGFPVEINNQLIEFTGYIEFLNKES